MVFVCLDKGKGEALISQIIISYSNLNINRLWFHLRCNKVSNQMCPPRCRSTASDNNKPQNNLFVATPHSCAPVTHLHCNAHTVVPLVTDPTIIYSRTGTCQISQTFCNVCECDTVRICVLNLNNNNKVVIKCLHTRLRACNTHTFVFDIPILYANMTWSAINNK